MELWDFCRACSAVGGGFLITPLLFFIGIPPAVAVATGANQVVASSISGVLAQMRRRGVDFRMGLVLLLGGMMGSGLGIWVFALMTAAGQIDLFVQLAYVLFLGLVGLLMLQEAVRTMLRNRGGKASIRRSHVHTWVHRLPLKIKFRISGLYISVLPPMVIGALVGFLSAVMGGRRRFYHGTSDDLPFGHANESRYWYVTFPDYFCNGFYNLDARHL